MINSFGNLFDKNQERHYTNLDIFTPDSLQQQALTDDYLEESDQSDNCFETRIFGLKHHHEGFNCSDYPVSSQQSGYNK